MTQEQIDKVADAIDAVQCFSRINDWGMDRVHGLPVEVCRYGRGREPEIVVLRRFQSNVLEREALREVIREQRAIAAIKAMEVR